MGNKRNRRSKRADSPSLERENSASETDNNQGNETLVHFPNNENVSETYSLRTQLAEPSRDDNEMEAWSQRVEAKIISR